MNRERPALELYKTNSSKPNTFRSLFVLSSARNPKAIGEDPPEALIVAGRRNVDAEMTSIIDGLGFDVVPVTAARRVARAYARWGKGANAAALDFGDCFAYEVAKEHDCRLLYVGDDFSKTDIGGVL
ncbi:MAG: type II toxin-antitoxin system VapC family toxin [Enhydrobacter sp.]|nr:MAG: type II toxin-antitoxin system VapC family toxin [Enhydrobacter sp.]